MSTNSQITKEQVLQIYREAVIAGVPLDHVQKRLQAASQLVDQIQQYPTSTDVPTKQPKRNGSKLQRMIPMVMITFGSIMIANALWPILSYVIFTSPYLQRTQFISPVPEKDVVAYSAVASPVGLPELAYASEKESIPKPVILSEQLDYTNLANWFVDTHAVGETTIQKEIEYTIDIPAVNVEKAKVKIGGTDLNNNLIQYPGTSAPGDIGAPVIFGHSVLRQFYRPDISNPNRYKSIFSKIMTLKVGDEIIITHEDVKYTYKVKEKHEVQPDDLFILEQRHDSRELKLITCVPEGTYLRRGVIVAQLEKIE